MHRTGINARQNQAYYFVMGCVPCVAWFTDTGHRHSQHLNIETLYMGTTGFLQSPISNSELVSVGPLGYFIHLPMATPIAPALKNYSIYRFLEVKFCYSLKGL